MPDHSIFVSTTPFGESDRRPMELLQKLGVPFRKNETGHRLTSEELAENIGASTVLIAGTEGIHAGVLDRAPNLRLIARVGIGLDSVDLAAARARGIRVTYTPEAPGLAVAELTMGLMLNLLRGVCKSDRALRKGTWHRIPGARLGSCTVGVVGVGRIGSKVIRHLLGAFPSIKILANDIREIKSFDNDCRVQWVTKEQLFREADIVTLHVPLTPATDNLVATPLLGMMKASGFLINTSRGRVVSERDLFDALSSGRIAGAALDVFEQEPYKGSLVTLDSCILTCHMGSMTHDCRARMEIEATEEACRFIRGEPLLQEVPETEYELQEASLRPC